jgi:L-serine deaminase
MDRDRSITSRQALGAFFKITYEIQGAAMSLVAGSDPASLDHVLEEMRSLE